MNVLMIGLGAVGRTLLELWKLENFKINNIVAVEPRDVPTWCFEMYPQLQHIKKALTKANLSRTLTPLLKEQPFVVDVSVDVDAVKIMALCKKYKCHYINTSVEGWEDKNPAILKTDRNALIKRSLVKREEMAEKAVGSTKTTMLTNMGANPGLISCLAQKGLHDYTMKYGDKGAKELLAKEEYAKLAKHLQLEEIHISELDTQICLKHRPKGHFFNTWSAMGFIAEALDPVQISDGTNRRKDGGGIVYKNMRIFPIRGMDQTCESVVCGLKGETKRIEGMLIPHAEADSLSQFLTDGDYRPSVFYVYDCSKVGHESIDELRSNNYKPVPLEKCYVLENQDIEKGGYDSLGALLLFPKHTWWCGTVLSIDEARRLGFKHVGATTVQVAISMFNAIKYINRNKTEGLIEPEDLNWKTQIKGCEKYLGNLISKEL